MNSINNNSKLAHFSEPVIEAWLNNNNNNNYTLTLWDIDNNFFINIDYLNNNECNIRIVESNENDYIYFDEILDFNYFTEFMEYIDNEEYMNDNITPDINNSEYSKLDRIYYLKNNIDKMYRDFINYYL